MRTTKAQISLRIRTVRPAPFLFAAWIVYYLRLTSFSIPFWLRNKDFSCFIVLTSRLLSRILGEKRSPSITGTNNPITINHLSIIILNYPAIITNYNYQLQVIWIWTKVSGNCLQKCRGTVFKSVEELSPKAVSGNCLVPAHEYVKNWWKLPISDPKTDLNNIDAHSKFAENSSCRPETDIRTCGGQITQ